MITTPLSNCSASPASKIAEFVRHTDAAYERLIRPGDRLMANKRWVAWLDTQDRPGIVRCLWGVDRDANFVGITEPEIAPDAAQSVLAIARAFVSTDAPYGYKGLHVEIWKTLERTPPIADECAPANCVYTVPNPVVFACGTPSSTSRLGRRRRRRPPPASPLQVTCSETPSGPAVMSRIGPLTR